jgi:hypothetical protein
MPGPMGGQMVGRMMFDPTRFGIEIVFSLLIIAICILIYFKTKEIYDLSKHKGIRFFRNTFLFFSLAYLFRILFLSIHFSGIFWEFHNMRTIRFIPLTIVGLFSSLAIVSLTLSIIWKKNSSKTIEYLMYVLVAIITIGSILYKSPFTILFLELILFIFAITISMVGLWQKKKKNHLPNLIFIYALLFLSWLVSIFTIATPNMATFGAPTISYIISIAIFIIIFLKVRRWTK